MQILLRSTRIRVWRVSHTDAQQSVTAASAEMTFQIEYLVGKNEFGVITLNTLQVCLCGLGGVFLDGKFLGGAFIAFPAVDCGRDSTGSAEL